MPIYVCPICGRTAELPEGKYYCKVCGPAAIMREATIPKKRGWGVANPVPSGVYVKNRKEITAEDLYFFSPELPKKLKEWVVIVDGFIYDDYETRAEAEKEANLLKKAIETVDIIEKEAEAVLGGLTPEQISFLRKYTGGAIRIVI